MANSKVIAVEDQSGTIKIQTRKVKASPQAVAKATSSTTIRPRSGSRRAIGIAAAPAKRGYRPDLRAVGIPIAYSVSIFCFAFSIPDQRNLVRTHWNYCKVIEGWAWTRLQYKHNPLRPIKPQWKLRLVAIGHRSLLNAAVRLVGDDILLLFFPFTQGFQRLLFNADTLHQ